MKFVILGLVIIAIGIYWFCFHDNRPIKTKLNRDERSEFIKIHQKDNIIIDLADSKFDRKWFYQIVETIRGKICIDTIEVIEVEKINGETHIWGKGIMSERVILYQITATDALLNELGERDPSLNYYAIFSVDNIRVIPVVHKLTLENFSVDEYTDYSGVSSSNSSGFLINAKLIALRKW